MGSVGAEAIGDRREHPQARFWQLDIQTVLVLVAFGIAFFLAAQPRIDVDLGWHLRTGQLIWETGAIPHSDPYSFTVNGQPWITHEWLSEVIFWPVYANWGHAGLMILCSTILTVGLWFVYRQMRDEACPRVLAALLVVLSTLTGLLIWGTRPTVFTLLLAPLFAWLLRRWSRGDNRGLWALPPLMAVWVNLHGGYMFGLGLIAIYFFGGLAARWLPGDRPRGSLRGLAWAGAFCLLATLLNPNTYQILWYPFDTLTSEAMRKYLGDWPSPDFHAPRFWPFAAMLALFFLSAARDLRRLPMVDVLLLLALAGLGLQSNRHIPLFAVICTPVLARQLPALAEDARILAVKSGLARLWRSGNRPLRRGALLALLNWLVLALAGILLAAGVADSISPQAIAKVQDAGFPVQAVAYIKAHAIEGRIYNAYNWGGYLVLNFYPERSVFIDSRADVYRDEFIEEYLETYYVRPNWRSTLDQHAVQYALLEYNGPLHILLTTSGEWREIYSDPVAVLLERQTPPSSGTSR